MDNFRKNKLKRTHLGLTVIIVAALLLELTTGVMYYSAQSIIQRTVNRLVQREMNALYLCIRNKLVKFEVTLDNMAWVVTDDLAEPDSLMAVTRQTALMSVRASAEIWHAVGARRSVSVAGRLASQ